ncbi:MAG: gephyrin-like molybdotransferase Glp [Bacteroidales bacterium]
MISFQEAYSIVISKVIPIDSSENISLSHSIGRVLAQDVTSDINMPPFRKTAVDGYACRMSDITNKLEIIEVIPAGVMPTKTIETGQCAKIMTGAPLPSGADCVLMVEDTKIIDEKYIEFTRKSTKANICELGEDIRIGDLSIEKGTTILPKHIAIMAALGCHQPKVVTKPKVSILPTGDELVEPDVKPTGSQIRNSNGHQLISQVINSGAEPIYNGIVGDTKEETYKAISQALEQSDVVILTGGVSMGDFDFVPEIMSQLGVQIHFNSIAVQPGKPTTFGTKGNKLIFGLPGNPVSSFVQFELLVKPVLLKMMGCKTINPFQVKATMGTDYSRKRSERLAFVPVMLTEQNLVLPVEFHGSAHIFALSKANGIISVPIGIEKIDKGELVYVRPI